MSTRSGRGKSKLGRGIGSGFEEWGGYMSAKIQKLQAQFAEETPEEGQRSDQKSEIFKNIAIFVNGYTRPPSDELKRLMMQHGGTYIHYYRRTQVTHIIASNLPNSKATNLTDKKVVRPDWITDSIKAGKLLSHEPYLLFTSRTKSQPGLDKFSVKTTTTNMSVRAAPTAVSTPSSLQKHPTSPVAPSSAETNTNTRSVVQSSTESSVDVSSEPTVSQLKGSKLQNHPEEPTSHQMISPIEPSLSKISPNKSFSSGPSPSKPSSASSSDGFKSIGDARDPSFISEFYNNSRLHHISTWGAEYKALVTQLQTSGDTSFPGRARLRAVADQRTSLVPLATGKTSRLIMHVDMDCFFVSVGLRSQPDLVDKPVAVTHSRGKGAKTERTGTNLSYEAAHYSKRGLKIRKGPGKGLVDPKLDPERNPDLLRMDSGHESDESDTDDPGSDQLHHPTAAEAFHSMSEIASCNYAARKAGVKNGMFMGKAKTLCPDLQTIPYDFDGYSEVSKCLYHLVASFTHDIEAVSCDEMLVDCTDLLADTGATPTEFAELLRKEIKEKTSCNASAGLGPNILLARMATRVAKPNGQFLLEANAAKEFIRDKSVSDLPGVGYAMVNKLSAMHITTCGELQTIPLVTLQRELGTKTGQSLYRYCRGEDSRPIRSEQERKSVSAEVNYGIRFTSEADVGRFMHELCGEVHNRLTKLHVKGKTITLKLKVRAEGAPKETAKFLGHGICNNVTKSVTIPMATDDTEIIAKEVMGIVRALRIPPSEYRGVGIQISRLETPVQRSTLSKGNQSILNFAAKPSNAANCSTTESPGTKSIADSSVISRSAGKSEPKQTSSPVVKSMAADRLGQGHRDKEVTVENRCHKTDGAETTNAQRNGVDRHTTATHDELTINHNELTSYQSSNSRSSETGTIEPTSRTKVNVILPPLPRLPDLKSPPNKPTPPPAPPPPPREDLFLPSPSQVDMDVLRELPPDIRAQIEDEMAVQRRPRRSRPETQPEQNTAVQPQLTNNTKDDEPIVPLPSFSQLDPSCIEALPPEMRAELIQAYNREAGRGAPSSPRRDGASLHPLMQAKNLQNSPKGSPRKHSPGRQTRGSPNFKKPRGRGPGRPRRELNFGKNAKTNKSVQEKVVQPALPSTSKETATPQQPSSSVTSSNNPEPGCSDSRTAVTIPEGVNLCGAVSVADVKQLIKEWSLSADAPEQTDVEQLTRYLHDLVADHNLERVFIVLKYFRRCVRNRPLSAEWEETYRDVCSQAQAIVQSTYGSRLKL